MRRSSMTGGDGHRSSRPCESLRHPHDAAVAVGLRRDSTSECAGSGASHRWIVVAAVLLTSFLLDPAIASATTPCPNVLYAVSYVSPLCIVTVLPPTPAAPYARLWWPATWNGTWNLSTGAGFDLASDHLDRDASAVESLTALDRDHDGSLSAGDALTVWSPGGCGGSLVLYSGTNRTYLTSYAYLLLTAGNVQSCGATPPDLVVPAIEIVVVASAFAVATVLVLLLWRRVPRG